MTLYDQLPNSVIHNHKKYALNLSFDKVLKFYDIQSDKNLDEYVKMEATILLFVVSKCRPDIVLYKKIVDIITAPIGQKKAGEKCFDFAQDAGYIYAAFRQAYNMDLTEECGRLHWYKFVWLLFGLPEDTKFSGILQIRTKKLPPATKYNAAERAAIIAQKAAFALKRTDEEREADWQTGLQNIASTLIRGIKK